MDFPDKPQPVHAPEPPAPQPAPKQPPPVEPPEETPPPIQGEPGFRGDESFLGFLSEFPG